MKFGIVVPLGRNSITLEGEATDEKDLFRQLAFWHSLPQNGPNGELDLYIEYRTPKNFKYYSIVCPSARMEFCFGETQKDQKLFPKGWHPVGHDVKNRFAECPDDDDDESPIQQQPKPAQAEKPATQPNLMPVAPAATKTAPLMVEKKEMHAAAMAAQAPAAVAAKIETGLERACPANVEPDEWDARCVWIDRLLEVTGRWPKAYERNWLSDKTQVAPFTSDDLYHVDASELAAIYEEAKANAVPREASLTQEEKFRQECADAGFEGDVDRLAKKYTFRGQSEPNYDLARKELASLVQRRSQQQKAAGAK